MHQTVLPVASCAVRVSHCHPYFLGVSVGHIGADELLLGLTACLWYAKCFLLCTVMSKP